MSDKGQSEMSSSFVPPNRKNAVPEPVGWY